MRWMRVEFEKAKGWGEEAPHARNAIHAAFEVLGIQR